MLVQRVRTRGFTESTDTIHNLFVEKYRKFFNLRGFFGIAAVASLVGGYDAWQANARGS